MFESNQENSYEHYTQNRLQKDGPLLAKWLWILFWVAIAGFLPSILSLVAIFLSSFIFLPIISTLITLASLIAVLVCMILKYCYLYRTATVFRPHQRKQAENGMAFDTTR